MNKLLAIALILVCTIGPFQAQDSVPPLCSEAEWETLAELEDDYYALVDRSTVARP